MLLTLTNWDNDLWNGLQDPQYRKLSRVLLDLQKPPAIHYINVMVDVYGGATVMIQSTSVGVPFQATFRNGSHEAVADLPIEKGGAGQGFGPHELVEAALATCLTITVEMCAAKHQLPLTGVQCEVRIDRSNPDAVTLNYSLAFDGPLNDEQSAKLHDAASRCPVGRTLTGNIQLQPSTTPTLNPGGPA